MSILKIKSQLLIPIYEGKSISSETTMVAEQCRLQERTEQIRDYQRRPTGMGVCWCACHGSTKANYYQRLRRVREACLESISGEDISQQVVPVRSEFLRADEKTAVIHSRD